MKITKFRHEDVSEDGTCKSGGAVKVEGGMEIIKGSCDLAECKCSEGFFLVICKPLKDGVVEGCSIEFDSLEELLICTKFNKVER